jgi:hypothetical protein
VSNLSISWDECWVPELKRTQINSLPPPELADWRDCRASLVCPASPEKKIEMLGSAINFPAHDILDDRPPKRPRNDESPIRPADKEKSRQLSCKECRRSVSLPSH